MKKYSFLIFSLLALILSNCSSDEAATDDEVATDDEITPPVPVIDTSGNLLAIGDSANDILSNDNFTSLVIEATFAPGFKPTDEAMDFFVDYLKEHTFKEDIEVIFRELPSPNEETLTLAEVIALEDANRTVFNQGETVGIYIFFADAPSDSDDPEENTVTLGAVYRNTSMIIYESTLRELAATSTVITDADLEGATLTHEFGHLFGLVNLGSPPVNPEHDDGEGHCNVPGCLMLASLEFGAGIMDMMLSGIVPVLDPECILDIQANGAR